MPWASGFGVDHPEGGIPPKAFLFCNQKRNRKKFHRFEAVDARPGFSTLDPSKGPPRTDPLSKEWIRERASPFSNLLYYSPPTEAPPGTESKPSGRVLENTSENNNTKRESLCFPFYREGSSRADALDPQKVFSLLFGSVFRQAQKGVQGVSPGRASTASKPVGLFRFLFGHKKERFPAAAGFVEVIDLQPAPGQRSPTGLVVRSRLPEETASTKRGNPCIFTSVRTSS